ncbi:hypothetical protein N7463_010106 [Penicillium fimorum]|uniref:Uncharacterized protein n=1 Tax=Penicillium fimorum TaxID=1882269 RepID=A0A9X0C1G8_9EURO|nr:hypothetical protein N7463_010106 [Penicillium fimorum]
MPDNQTLPNLQASPGFDRSANLNVSLIGPMLYWGVYGMEGFILNFNFLCILDLHTMSGLMYRLF